jgi:hypothetical protein
MVPRRGRVVSCSFADYPENIRIVTNNFGCDRFQVTLLQDEERKMFSHEGHAIELLLFVFGITGLLLVVWFIHHLYERKIRKGVIKQQNRNEGRSR